MSHLGLNTNILAKLFESGRSGLVKGAKNWNSFPYQIEK